MMSKQHIIAPQIGTNKNCKCITYKLQRQNRFGKNIAHLNNNVSGQLLVTTL